LPPCSLRLAIKTSAFCGRSSGFLIMRPAKQNLLVFTTLIIPQTPYVLVVLFKNFAQFRNFEFFGSFHSHQDYDIYFIKFQWQCTWNCSDWYTWILHYLWRLVFVISPLILEALNATKNSSTMDHKEIPTASASVRISQENEQTKQIIQIPTYLSILILRWKAILQITTISSYKLL
jgi:hypothetical protein